MSADRPTSHIPIEVLRTAVAIAELRTFGRAATRLGISQPAVSAQIKRLQQIVGGEIFERDVGGNVPTQLGEIVIALGRTALDAHDQILRLKASDVRPERVRLGISSLLIREYLHSQESVHALSNVFVASDSSLVLGKGIIEGRMDIVCCFAMEKFASDLRPFLIAEKEDSVVWVRAKEFVLSPGQPLPIVTWPGYEWMTQALVKHGLSYQIVFDGQDYEAIRAIVEAGLALIALPSRLIPSSLVRAREYYLPQLPSIQMVLYVKPASLTPKMIVIKDQLRDLFFRSDAHS